MRSFIAATALIAAQSAVAIVPSNFHLKNFAFPDEEHVPVSKTVQQSSTAKAYNFAVPVDHFHNDTQYEPHSNGTFNMRYFLETSFYKPGGPVIVIASGETSAEDRVPYLTNGVGSLLAKATNGLVISLEHRYYGTSFPVSSVSDVKNYRFLTTEQAVADTAYFAKNVKFPGFEKVDLTAPNTPWIIYGGSYAGAFAAFTRKLYPDAFWGAISSSGVTKAVYDYWEYNEAARLFAPGNCGGVMANLTYVVDTALFSGDDSKNGGIKELFGDNAGTNDGQFGNRIGHPGSALQSESWVKGQSSTLLPRYCNTITSATLQYSDLESQRSAAEQFVQDAGLPKSWATQLLNYVGLQRGSSQAMMKRAECSTSKTYDECLDATLKTRAAQISDDYSWFYQTCTEWGYYVSGSGAPENIRGLLSRAVTIEQAASGCDTAFGIYSPPNTDVINRLGGTDFSYPRVAIIDGKQDPWRAATPHKIGANTDRKSTTEEPFILIDYATHHWDEDDVPASQYGPGYPPKQIVDVHNQEVAFVKAWLEEFKQHKA